MRGLQLEEVTREATVIGLNLSAKKIVNSFMSSEDIVLTRKPTTAIAGIFIISNAALGAGTLAFPNAFAKSGLILSFPLLGVSELHFLFISWVFHASPIFQNLILEFLIA